MGHAYKRQRLIGTHIWVPAEIKQIIVLLTKETTDTVDKNKPSHISGFHHTTTKFVSIPRRQIRKTCVRLIGRT